MKKPPLLGAHTSTAGGFDQAIDRALSIDANAMQIFVKNNLQWFAEPLTTAELRAFHDHPRRAQVQCVFGHSGYLLNLAATNPDFLEKSRRSLREELERAHRLDLPFLVLHPGAHLGAGEEAGLTQVAASLDEIFAALPKNRTRIALETTAGQGTCLGHSFAQLAAIIAQVREPERLVVCIDTAHLFAAGYDLTSTAGTKQTFAEFERVIGFDRLAAIHCNDSKTPRGSRVDRHEHLGQGHLGLAPFQFLMTDRRFAKIPKILETPKGKNLAEDRVNLGILRQLANKLAN